MKGSSILFRILAILACAAMAEEALPAAAAIIGRVVHAGRGVPGEIARMLVLVAGKIDVIAHRGAHEQQPQNSMAAYVEAIRLGCDYIEIDLRTAPDGALLIKHDPIQPGDALPTFDDVLALAKGRIRIYLDVKQAMPAAIIATVEKHAMRNSILTYGGLNLLRDLVRLRPGWPTLPEAFSAESLRIALNDLKPKAVAFSSHLNPEILAIAREADCAILADCLGRNDNPNSWQQAVDAGATGIQTDRPTALLEWLRARKLHA